MKNNASNVVSSAILGYDCANVLVGGNRYIIPPPTIHKLMGAGYYLSDVGEAKTVKDMFSSFNNAENLTKALSWLIAGNESLVPVLNQASFEEVVEALDAAYSLISVQSFIKLSTLARSVASLTAKQRQ